MTYLIRCPGSVLSYTELAASAIVDVGSMSFLRECHRTSQRQNLPGAPASLQNLRRIAVHLARISPFIAAPPTGVQHRGIGQCC